LGARTNHEGGPALAAALTGHSNSYHLQAERQQVTVEVRHLQGSSALAPGAAIGEQIPAESGAIRGISATLEANRSAPA
jgi:predicted aconitase